MPKPSDFFVGVTEFFAVLLPGASVLYLLRPIILTNTPGPWLPHTPLQGWAVFLVLAYIAGHLLHAIGSWLIDDYIYGKFYLPRRRSPHWRAAKWISEADPSSPRDSSGLFKDAKAAATLLARVYITNRVDPRGTNYYDWCLSDLRVNSPNGAAEVDRLQADSKFFRSMVFVFLLAALLGLRERPLWVSAGSAVLAMFAIWRFCELRWGATKRVYEYYLLLHPPSLVSGSAPELAQESAAPKVSGI